ncbi:hypothetical protein [Streptomyces fagopyri]|uniref:hypothetical protein n=1 Tax=Streptomyces fagopyri TaxID=2662397 RepID=UPI0037F63E11
MNDTSTSAGQAATPDLVQVVLGSCSVEDADTVLRTLGARLTPEGGHDEPHHDTGVRVDTWTAAFAVPHGAVLSPDVSLTGTVLVDLQGGPVAVGHMCEALASAFDVQIAGSVSGDQEIDMQVTLTNA